MRDKCPVAWSPSFGGFWALSKYDDMIRASKDWEQFSVVDGIMMPPTGASMKVIPAARPAAAHQVPQDDSAVLHRTRAARVDPGVRNIIDDAFAPVIRAGRADLVVDVARPVLVLAICLILGMLGEDWRQIRTLAEEFLAAAGKPELARAKAHELEAYLEQQI